MLPFQHSNFKILIPDTVFAPLASTFLILSAGLLGLALHRPWLFASLGPTAFQVTEYPEQKSSRFYNVVAGHLIGLAMGFAAVAIMNCWGAPKVLATHDLTAVRMWTAVLAVALTSAALVLLRASHPPAAATALLVALGAFSTPTDVVTVVVGVVIVGLLAEGLRFIRLRRIKEAAAEQNSRHGNVRPFAPPRQTGRHRNLRPIVPRRPGRI